MMSLSEAERLALTPTDAWRSWPEPPFDGRRAVEIVDEAAWDDELERRRGTRRGS